MFWLLLYLGLCSLVGWLGAKRRFGFWGYFIVSFIFTPLVGLLLVSASDKPKPASQCQWNKVVSELDDLRAYVARFECAGLTAAETRELAHRLTALRQSVISKTE
jgi:hypothetical protein